MNHKISIILPTYNRGSQCVNVIQNMFNQTYNNWELIVINDGSSNNNTKIIENYINSISNDKIKYFKNNNNVGIASSLNIGLKKITGEYFTWISDDNFIMNNFLYEMIRKKCDFSYSDYIYNSSRVVKLNYDSVSSLINKFMGMVGFLWKKNIVDKIGGFNTVLSGLCEDYDYEIRTFLATENIGKINKPLVNYVINFDSQTVKNSNKIKKNHKIVTTFYNIYLKLLSNKDKYIVHYSNVYNINTLNKYSSEYGKILICNIDKKIDSVDDILILDPIYEELVNNILYHITNRNKIIEKIYDEKRPLSVKKIKKMISLYRKKTSLSISSINPDNKKFKIGLVGYINYGNFGDELFFSIYSKLFKNSKLYINDFDVDEVDAIIFCGGDIFMEYYISPVYFKEKFLNKPIYFNSVSVDFLNSFSFIKNVTQSKLDYIKKFYVKYLSHPNVKQIHLRDKKSYEYILQLIPNYKNKIFLSTDISYMLHNNFNLIGYKSVYDKRQKLLKNRILIIVKKKDLILYKKIIQKLNENGVQYTIMSVSLFGKERLEDNYIKKIYPKVLHVNNINEVFNTINRYEIIISSRFHPIIIGMMMGKKVYTASYENKILDIFNSYNMSSNILHNDIDVDTILKTNDVDLSDELYNKYLIANNTIEEIKFNIINSMNIVHIGSCLYKESDIIYHINLELKKLLDNYQFLDIGLYNGKINKNIKKIRERDGKKYSRYMNVVKKEISKEFLKKPTIIIYNSGGICFDKDFYFNDFFNISITLSDPDVYYYQTKFYYQNFDMITTNSERQLEIYKHKNKHLLNFGVSDEINHDLNIERIYDIIVVGGCRPERVEILDKLFALKKYKIKVCGGNWPTNYNAKFVSGSKQNLEINKAKIYLSFSKTMAGFSNVKVGIIEALSTGIVAITDTEKIYNFFNEDEVIYHDWYKDFDGFIEKIDFVLQNYDDLSYIQKSKDKVKNNHLWRNMFKKILIKAL